jgi:hypothetical protein
VTGAFSGGRFPVQPGDARAAFGEPSFQTGLVGSSRLGRGRPSRRVSCRRTALAWRNTALSPQPRCRAIARRGRRAGSRHCPRCAAAPAARPGRPGGTSPADPGAAGPRPGRCAARTPGASGPGAGERAGPRGPAQASPLHSSPAERPSRPGPPLPRRRRRGLRRQEGRGGLGRVGRRGAPGTGWCGSSRSHRRRARHPVHVASPPSRRSCRAPGYAGRGACPSAPGGVGPPAAWARRPSPFSICVLTAFTSPVASRCGPR